jgi:DNA-binding LacI/PurR family transcriptional regulator
MEVVRKHAFTPQWAAQSLRIRRTQTIGFAVPNLTNGFFGQIAMTIDAYFRQARYSTLICFTAKDYQNELESLGSLVSKNVDGIIFAPSGCGGRYLQDLPQLREKPLVLIDNACENLDGWCVLHDNRFGLKLLADHLVERGYRGIAFIGGPLEESRPRSAWPATAKPSGPTAWSRPRSWCVSPTGTRSTGATRPRSTC